ncbi:MAG: branched-chain amino acid ABC transporter permease [Anaerolineae bacterium CG_4_9_14_3_um_filter_57_17]|nr:branched-chain amino acid ABC transporter permease [bacterium]NCT20425.1 branched-chain amino acid ABC transporter permease [bacterium]OIO87388.1 MAG: branched-chain amino acid ABC transporter permease [Anaerolineae bacterium CG2_30_57_67]PJB66951.1 MAG: branched-chain amino acid ABC transporter permease [Anaerolineae bacterium CG_4_9_14_3_um_filter_57_17]
MISGIFHTTYEQDMALRTSHAQKVRLVILVLFLLAFPFFANRYALTLANQIGIAVIGAIGLNILVGYTGQISLGQGGFMAIGAYTAGILTARMGVPWWASTLIACFATAGIGAIFGIPSLRLKGLYLAIATLAAQEIILWVVTHWKVVTGGVDALVVPNPELFGLRMNTDFNFYWLVWALVIVVTLATVNLFRTHYGRAFTAIRDQDIAASVMGVDLFKYKLLAFAISSFLVGLAGALTAHYRSIVTWERFTIDVSVLYLAMIIIGGLGRVTGSYLGAIFMTLLPVVLSNLGRALKGVFPIVEALIPFIQQAAFGLVIILFLVFEPEGLNKIWKNIKDYFRLWPFSY